MPHILFVCHGNVARSAAAEIIARARAEPESPWRVSSAGVGALTGQPVASDVARSLEARGYHPGDHRARQVTPALVAEADIVVCMEPDQRRWILDESPAAARCIFVFGQLERVARHAPRRVEGLAHALLHQAPARPEDAVADPYRRGHQAAEVAVARIEDGVLAMGALLGFIRRPPAD